MKKSAFFLLLTAFYAGLVFGQNHRGTARVLRFSTPEKVSFAAFRRGDAPLKFALPAGDSLALQGAQTGPSGRRRYRLQQMHGGIPVFGAEGILLEENGALTWGKGRFRERIDAETSPALSEKAAFERALAAMPAEKYAWQEPAYERELKTASADPAASFFPKGKLVFLPDDPSDPSSGGVRLAWQFDVFAAAPEPARQLIFVDARDGKILRSIPLMHSGHVPAKGFARYVSDTVAFNTESLPGDTLYRLRDLIRNIHVRDALNLQSNPNADFVHNGTFWGKPEHRTPVAAHWGMKQWYDYMLQTHGWRGFANDSTPMMAWARFGHNFNNAFWNGNWVNFGDGDGIRFGPLVQLDIVAHECAHALVQNTCGLIYQGEPGALNEGLCDIFATLVERYTFPDAWNWKLGEAAYFDHANGLRRLDYPNVTGHPDTYGGQFWVNIEGCAPGVTNDQCGIHANCGVLGKFFYILAQGESGVSEAGMPYNVSGIGMNKAAEIIFLAMDDYLLPTDGFADMRAATLEAAYKLYPGTEAEVAKAWCAVGVGECTVAVSDSIVLKAPAAVDTFLHGQPIEVLWTATAGVKKVNLYLSLNDGASWQLIYSNLEAAAGQFEFPAPPVFSPVCRLRLADAENPFVSDRSDTTFVITGCGLKAHFIPSVTKVCYGQPFYAVNDSPDKDAYFQWRWNGTNFPSPDSLLEIPAMNVAGEHLIELIADDSAGCLDSFGLRVTVLPQVTATFSAETHGATLVANAHYQGADTYVWYYGGKQVGGNSPALTLTGLMPGADSLRLIVAENGCPGGVAEAVEGVTVDAGNICSGKGGWKQVTYTNDILDIAQKGDTLVLGCSGGLWYYVPSTGYRQLFTPLNSDLLTIPVNFVSVNKNGKVFAATDRGISVFDGFSWDSITTTGGQLPSNEILGMESDTLGNIWVVTRVPLQNQPAKTSIVTIHFDNSIDVADYPSWYNIEDIHSNGKNLYIVEYKSIIKIIGHGEFEYVLTGSLDPECMDFDSKGNIWMGVNGLAKYDIQNDTIIIWDDLSIYSTRKIIIDKNDNIWLYDGYSLKKFDGSSVTDVFTFNNAFYYNYSGLITHDFFVNRNGDLLIGTKRNLFRYNGTGFDTLSLAINNLLNRSVDDMLFTPDLKILLTSNGSLHEFSPTALDILSSECVADFKFEKMELVPYLDGKYEIWSWEYGTSIFGRLTKYGFCQKGNYLNPPFSMGAQSADIYDIKEWDPFVLVSWSVSSSGDVFLFNKSDNSWTKLSDYINFPLQYCKLSEGDNKSLWLISSFVDTLIEVRIINGIFEFIKHSPPNKNFSSSEWFSKVYVTSGDTVWVQIATPDIISRRITVRPYNRKTQLWGEKLPIILGQNPTVINEDELHNIWIATESNGVYVFDPQAGALKSFSKTNSGLPSNSVLGVTFIPDGTVYLNTNNGIGIYTPSEDSISPSFFVPQICQFRPTTFSNTTLGATTFEWRLDDQPIATTKNLTYTFIKAGKYILTLIARNAQGCETATSRVIEVHPAADLSPTPAIWAHCDNSTQLEAPAGMAAYEWREASGKVVGTAAKLPVTQSGLYTLKVTDHCGSAAIKQITVLLADCVWPGDVNADGIVDYRDWVAMTLVFGYTGPARDEQGTSFQGYPALPWNGQLPNGANIKHADADGNGIIDMADFEAIEVNYGKTHGAYPGLDGPKPSPMQFVPVILEAPTDSNGHKMTVGILAIDSSGLLNSFSGAGFVLGWNDPAPIKFAVPPAANFSIATSIGKEGSTVQSIARYLPDRNEMHLARAVTDHRNRTNVSLLAQVDFIIIEDNIGIGDTLDIVFSISGAQALTGDGAFLPIGTGQGKFTFVGDTAVVVHTNDPFQPDDFGLLLFPNPSEGVFTAILPASGLEKTTLTVHDAQGRPVWRQDKAGAGAVRIDLTTLPAGSYYLRAVNMKGQAVRQLMKM